MITHSRFNVATFILLALIICALALSYCPAPLRALAASAPLKITAHIDAQAVGNSIVKQPGSIDSSPVRLGPLERARQEYLDAGYEGDSSLGSDLTSNNFPNSLQRFFPILRGLLSPQPPACGAFSLSLGPPSAKKFMKVNSPLNINNITNSFTVEAWIKQTALTGARQTLVSHFQTLNNGDGGFLLRLNANNFVEFYAYTNSVAGTGARVTSTGAVPFNAQSPSWHHVAGVLDVAAGKIRVFIDGVLSGEAASVFPNKADCNLYVGVDNNSTNYYSGLIDAVRIRNSAAYTGNFRPDPQAQAEPADTLGSWRFDCQDGTDSGFYGYTGAFFGSTPIDFPADVPAAGSNQLPVVSINSPANGQSFTTSASISISASASDSDGFISQMQIFGDGSLLSPAPCGGSPCSTTWSVSTTGPHTIRVTATDNQGGVSERSISISVTSGAPPPPPSNPKITGITATASGTYSTFAPAQAVDGNLNTSWVVGSAAPPTQWILLDLGQNYNVSDIKLYVDQSPNGNTVHNIYVGSTPNSLTQVHIFNGFTSMGDILAKNFSPTLSGVRYVKVETTQSATAWVAWKEIEVYGVASGAPPPPPPPSPGNLSSERVDPINRTGQASEDLYSGNYNWSLPIVSLQGRAGLDLSLSLAYNSRVWTKDQSTGSIKFDADKGFPAPGFRLGFPVIEQQKYTSQAGTQAYLMITSSGGHVELRQANSNIYESGDSTYIQLTELSSTSLLVRTSDGTQFSYQLLGSAFRCVQITDRNGNFISATYDSTGRISQVTDTLARTINFLYDASGNLQFIRQTWNGVAHDWASFSWQSKTLRPSFSVSAVAPTSFWALVSVTLGDTSTYGFDYSTFGQVNKITHFAGAGDGHTLAYISYNLSTSGGQSDCPLFTQRTDFAENWTTVITSFVIDRGTGNGYGQTTFPDNTVVREYHDFSDYRKGLATRIDTLSLAAVKKSVQLTWEQDNEALSYPNNPRVRETRVTDDQGNVRRSTTSYTSFGLPSDVYEYDADAVTVLRRTHIDYNNDSAYLNRRILGLPDTQTVFNQSGGVVAKTSFEYDLGSQFLTDTSAAPTNHDASYGPTFSLGRGNLCRVNRWDADDPQNNSKAVAVRQIGYFTTGAPRFVKDASGHGVTLNYTDSFSDGSARNTFAYPTTVSDAENFSSTAIFNYDMGVVISTRDPKGAEMQMEYNDPAGRLTKQQYVDTVLNQSGTYTIFEYPTSMREIRTRTLLDPGVVTYSAQALDGMGRVIGTVRQFFTGGSLSYSGQKMVYDSMGRLRQQSNPAQISYSPGFQISNWIPTGDDASGWVFTTQDYDWNGRPTVTTNPDATSTRVDYTGCGCAGGAVQTFTDEGTLVNTVVQRRRQRTTSDVFGRPFKTEMLNFDGSVYTTSVSTYNGRDQVTSIKQYQGTATNDGSCPTGTCQETLMTYDGHGRLQSRKAPAESSPTVYSYNPDDTLQKITDARNVQTNYSYNNRHLVTSISYDVTSAPGVPATPGVSYSYDSAGNRRSMSDGLGSVVYEYDNWSRLSGETRRFNAINGGSTPFPITYSYTLAGQLKSLSDPWGGVVNYAYDAGGQLSGVTGSGTAASVYASQAQYRAWGDLKQLTYGSNRTLTLSYDTRLRLSRYDLSGIMATDYQYYPDGRVKYVGRNGASWQDRAYRYDQVGRLQEALSGAEARGGSTADGPFRQIYQHNVWNNMVGRTNWSWGSGPASYSDTYVNDRNQAWSYDASGNPTAQDSLQTTYDAAERRVQIRDFNSRGPRFPSGVTISQSYDGDGQRLKQTEGALTTYFLRSSSLSGQVIAEVLPDGSRNVRYVYSNSGALLAQETASGVNWLHTNPVTGSQASSNLSGGSALRAELDPLGLSVGFTAPDNGFSVGSDLTFPRYGDAANLKTGCTIEGAPASCDLAMLVQEHLQDANVSTVFPPGFDIKRNHTTLPILVASINGGVNMDEPPKNPQTGDMWTNDAGVTYIYTGSEWQVWDPSIIVTLSVTQDADKPVQPEWPVLNPLDPGSRLPERTMGKDRSEYAVNTMLGLCGSVSIAEYHIINESGWIGANFKRNPNLNWSGNRFTGGISVAKHYSETFHFLGVASWGLSSAISVGQGIRSLNEGKSFTSAFAKPGVDIAVGAVGAFGGPPGWVLSTGYFAFDSFFGWKSLASSEEDIRRCHVYYKYGK